MKPSSGDFLIQALVVGSNPGTMQLLQRHTGGILKGIARVGCCHIDQVMDTDADLYLSSAHGRQYYKLKGLLKNSGKIILGVELSLLPITVRKLRMLPKDIVLGVVAQHQTCANYLFSRIVRAGVAEYKFKVGTFAEMKKMQVDKFVVSEENRNIVNRLKLSQETIFIARSVSPTAAAKLIDVAVEIATNK